MQQIDLNGMDAAIRNDLLCPGIPLDFIENVDSTLNGLVFHYTRTPTAEEEARAKAIAATFF